MTGELEHLMSRLGAQLTSSDGRNPNGRFLLLEWRTPAGKVNRVMLEVDARPETVREMASAALAVACRGRKV